MGQILYIGSPFQNSIRKHLTAYYPFNTDFEDRIEPKANLSSSGTSTISLATGRIGNAAFCPAGTNTALRNLTDLSRHKLSFTNGTNDLPYSISFHFYLQSVGSAQNGVLWGKNAQNSTGQSTNAEYLLNVAQDLSYIRWIKYSEGSNANFIQYQITAPSANAWHHLAITDDAMGNVRIYIDGVEVSKTTTNGGTGFVKFSQTSDSYIGCFNALGASGSTRFLQGGIDDLGIWVGRVLTQQNIDWIYNGGNPRPLL